MTKQQVIDEDRRHGINRAKRNVITRMVVFPLVPVQHSRQFAAVRAEAAVRGALALALVNAEPLSFRIVPDMAGLNDDQVLTVMGVWAMPVGCHLAANPSVIERKRAKVLGQKDEGIIRLRWKPSEMQ